MEAGEARSRGSQNGEFATEREKREQTVDYVARNGLARNCAHDACQVLRSWHAWLTREAKPLLYARLDENFNPGLLPACFAASLRAAGILFYHIVFTEEDRIRASRDNRRLKVDTGGRYDPVWHIGYFST
jgi:hypothetical protein